MIAIMGMTELTLGTDLSEEQRNYQHLVEQSARALLMLLNDVLDYSKIEAGKLELEQREIDLRDSVGDILQTHQSEEIVFNASIEANCAPIHWNSRPD